MNNSTERPTETSPVVGEYQQVTTVHQSNASSTNVESQQLRTVSTTVTEGEVLLRYTPREPSESQNTKT